jgi:hypothetical protein
MDQPPTLLQTTKDVLIAINSLVSSCAFLVGGYWSWKLFVKRRHSFPCADITQSISHHPFGDKVLVRVTVTIVNKGEVLMEIKLASTRFLLVNPYETVKNSGELVRIEGGCRLDWPLLEDVKYYPKTSREIEPGESDEIHFDYLAEPDVQTIIAHTNIHNHVKQKGNRVIVWEKSTIYDLVTPAATVNGAKNANTIPEEIAGAVRQN